MVIQFQHVGGRCLIGAGDDGWPIRSAMTAKGAGDDEKGQGMTAKGLAMTRRGH